MLQSLQLQMISVNKGGLYGQYISQNETKEKKRGCSLGIFYLFLNLISGVICLSVVHVTQQFMSKLEHKSSEKWDYRE